MEKTKETDNFAREALPILKKLGYINNKNTILYVCTAFIIGLTLSGVLFYGIYNDKFKSDISQSVQPQIDVNSTTNNQYDLNIPTNNKFYLNHTFYINNIIPECNCG